MHSITRNFPRGDRLGRPFQGHEKEDGMEMGREGRTGKMGGNGIGGRRRREAERGSPTH